MVEFVEGNIKKTCRACEHWQKYTPYCSLHAIEIPHDHDQLKVVACSDFIARSPLCPISYEKQVILYMGDNFDHLDEIDGPNYYAINGKNLGDIIFFLERTLVLYCYQMREDLCSPTEEKCPQCTSTHNWVGIFETVDLIDSNFPEQESNWRDKECFKVFQWLIDHGCNVYFLTPDGTLNR